MSNSNSTQSRVQLLFIKSVLGDLEEDLGKEETDQGLISVLHDSLCNLLL